MAKWRDMGDLGGTKGGQGNKGPREAKGLREAKGPKEKIKRHQDDP